MKKLFPLVFTMICFLSFAQEITVIQNVKLFDGEQVYPQAQITIRDGLIEEISTDSLDSQDGTIYIDGTGKTIMPGLINSHVHVWDKSQLKMAFKAGVFAVLDMHSPADYTNKLRDLRLSDRYAKFYSSGYAATKAGGHGTQYGFKVPVISDSLNEEAFVKHAVSLNSDYIKIIFEPVRPTLLLNQVKELIRQSHLHDLLAVAHISNLRDALNLFNLGIDGLVHVWDDAVISESEVDQLASDDLFVIPTLSVHEKVKQYYHDNGIENSMLELSDIKQNVRLMHQHQIPILAGTDPPNLGLNYGSSLFHELELLVESGLSPIEAMRSATSLPTKHFQLGGLGIIKEAGSADFIMISGDPTKDISNISQIESIWIGGKIIIENNKTE